MRRPLPAEIPLADKVRFLRRPEIYPDAPARVETKESHMSWVFLTREHAYKLKKPVRYPYLDFGTIAARRRNCEAELRLNRRLAPEVYLGVVPLGVDATGALQLGTGEPCDWLVKMRRLPAEQTLEARIERDSLVEDEVRTVAEKLAHFYRHERPVEMSAAEYRRRCRRDMRESGDELGRPEFGLPAALVQAPVSAQLAFLDRDGALLNARVQAGRIIEAHGDLRPEHIYLTSPPVVMDCLEFNRTLRLLDPADELAYLAIECERMGAPWIGRLVLDVYREITGDDPPARLLDFYSSFRATLRAKLAIWHLDDPEVQERARWIGRAVDYLRIAEAYAPRLR